MVRHGHQLVRAEPGVGYRRGVSHPPGLLRCMI